MKIFVYDEAVYPVHDKDPVYYGVIPFSRYVIKDNLTNDPDEADLFYCGQFNDTDAIFIPKYKDYGPHICDIEGDWFRKYLPDSFFQTFICSMNSVKGEYSQYLNRIFIRPTFSKLLLKLIKQEPIYRPNYNRQFSFMGFPDPLGIRTTLCSLYKDSGNIVLTDKWNGASDDADVHHRYIDNMLSGTFSLCPRGTGVDSVRFLESCFFGRIPIVVSDGINFGHDYDKPFYLHVYPSQIEMVKSRIEDMSMIDISEYSRNAISFFNNHVLAYFSDPTSSFLRWYNERYPSISH